MEGVFFASNPHRLDGHVERPSFVPLCIKLSAGRDLSGEQIKVTLLCLLPGLLSTQILMLFALNKILFLRCTPKTHS